MPVENDCTKVLIVDDEISYLIALKKLFREKGMKVDTTETLEHAITLIQQKDYDFVISDIRLTNHLRDEGLRLLKHIKMESPSTKVVVITGYGDPQTKHVASELGADFYFEKPVSSKTLMKIIRSY